jgi:hypothetical protein
LYGKITVAIIIFPLARHPSLLILNAISYVVFLGICQSLLNRFHIVGSATPTTSQSLFIGTRQAPPLNDALSLALAALDDDLH